MNESFFSGFCMVMSIVWRNEQVQHHAVMSTSAIPFYELFTRDDINSLPVIQLVMETKVKEEQIIEWDI